MKDDFLIESRNNSSPKSEVVHETKFNSYSVHIWFAQLNRCQISKPVVVSVVSSISTGGNFIFC